MPEILVVSHPSKFSTAFSTKDYREGKKSRQNDENKLKNVPNVPICFRVPGIYRYHNRYDTPKTTTKNREHSPDLFTAFLGIAPEPRLDIRFFSFRI